jgi:hypothetical protein
LARLRDVHRVIYGGMVRYAVEKQYLIEGQPNQNANGRIYLVRPRLAQLVEVPVQAPLPPHHAVYQLGKKRAVALIELGMALQGSLNQTVRM